MKRVIYDDYQVYTTLRILGKVGRVSRQFINLTKFINNLVFFKVKINQNNEPNLFVYYFKLLKFLTTGILNEIHSIIWTQHVANKSCISD